VPAVITPEEPPGFVVRTEAQKAAWDNGFRLERGVGPDGWLRYGSTTAHGEICVAGVSPRGRWLLSIDHPGVAAELAALPPAPLPGPGFATFGFDPLTELHAALDRVYKLGVSLPDAPLTRFRAQTAGLPQTTEVERLVVQRIGQDIFRAALMDYWEARCPITGITDPTLLRASHIVPWAECDDVQRLNVHNGLLLSALWDAAFDAGLVSFADDRTVLASLELSLPQGPRSASIEPCACPICKTPTAPTLPPIAPATGFRGPQEPPWRNRALNYPQKAPPPSSLSIGRAEAAFHLAFHTFQDK
jgi:HNH endonuclease